MSSRLLPISRIHTFPPLNVESFRLRRFLGIRFGLLERTSQVIILRTYTLVLASEFLPSFSLTQSFDQIENLLFSILRQPQTDALSAFREGTSLPKYLRRDPDSSGGYDSGMSTGEKVGVSFALILIIGAITAMMVQCCRGKDPFCGMSCNGCNCDGCYC